MRKGVDPEDDPRFKGKEVVFEGVLMSAYEGKDDSESVKIKMEAQPITIALKLFPGVSETEKVAPLKVMRFDLKPSITTKDAWKAIQPGASVKFKGTLGVGFVTLVTTSDLGGLIFLFIEDAQPLTPQ